MAAERPDLAAILAPILERVDVAQRPLLIALAERMAAVRYRGWASQVTDAAERAGPRDIPRLRDSRGGERRLPRIHDRVARATRDSCLCARRSLGKGEEM